MYWVPCLHVDLPEEAGEHSARWLAAAVEPIVAAVRANDVAHLNVAVSAAALLAFERHGCDELVDELVRLASNRRIELCGTAAHGALLPLVPMDEALRQLALDDEVNERVFGALYRPGCLWPPRLAVSRRVLEAAARHGFQTVVVDERAMRSEAPWPGERVDAADGYPGLFLLPAARAESEALASGRARTREDLGDDRPAAERVVPRHRILALEATPKLAPPRALLELLAREPTLRVQDLLKLFPLDRHTSPLPSSVLSTDADLASGLPFAPWYRPGDARQERRWKVLTRLAGALETMTERGLSAMPEVRRLRATLDLAWRESRWREGADEDLDLLRPLVNALAPELDGELASARATEAPSAPPV